MSSVFIDLSHSSAKKTIMQFNITIDSIESCNWWQSMTNEGKSGLTQKQTMISTKLTAIETQFIFSAAKCTQLPYIGRTTVRLCCALNYYLKGKPYEGSESAESHRRGKRNNRGVVKSVVGRQWKWKIFHKNYSNDSNTVNTQTEWHMPWFMAVRVNH